MVDLRGRVKLNGRRSASRAEARQTQPRTNQEQSGTEAESRGSSKRKQRVRSLGTNCGSVRLDGKIEHKAEILEIRINLS